MDKSEWTKKRNLRANKWNTDEFMKNESKIFVFTVHTVKYLIFWNLINWLRKLAQNEVLIRELRLKLI